MSSNEELDRKAAEALARMKAANNAPGGAPAPQAPQRVSFDRSQYGDLDAAYGGDLSQLRPQDGGASVEDAKPTHIPGRSGKAEIQHYEPTTEESNEQYIITSGSAADTPPAPPPGPAPEPMPMPAPAPAPEVGAEFAPVEGGAENDLVVITNVVRKNMNHMPIPEQNDFLAKLRPDMEDYKKGLILNYGMTPEEASQAMQARAKAKAIEEDRKWAEDHPNGVVVQIDATAKKTVVDGLDQETRAKMVEASAVKLVVLDTMELAHLPIKPKDKRLPMSRIRDISGSLSHYSIPLLELGDYVTFNGVQSGALINATVDPKTDDWLDMLEKRASVLYKAFRSGTCHSRMNPDGTEMSYEDFCNWYKYNDVDLGIYALVTASAMEVSTSNYICQNKNCGRPFEIKYNNKTLLDLSEIPDRYKKRLTEIDEFRSSPQKLSELIEQYDMGHRIQSPVTHNVFEIHSPTIAQARKRVESCLDLMTDDNSINIFMLLYVSKLFIYDPVEQNYQDIDVDEDPREAFMAMDALHQVDMEIVSKFLEDRNYTPRFRIKVACPHCKREAVDNLNINNLLFLQARASLTEIRA